MIRPSALQLAADCGLAPRLAEQHPESSPAADRGTEIHEEAARFVRSGGTWRPQHPAVRLLADNWVVLPGSEAEVPLRLEDPETGELITAGTADFLRIHDDQAVVVDWKSGRPENVEAPDENLQLHAYGLAAALHHGAENYIVGLCFLTMDGPDWRWAKPVVGADMWKMLDRIKAIASKPATATVGPHCGEKCYQRHHCPAFLLPAHEGESALAPFTGAGLSAATALKGLQVVQALKVAVEKAEAQIKDWARENGGVSDGNGKVWTSSQVAGRKTADVGALEKDGLTQYIRNGQPYERWGWKKRS